jgi:hypothetical protein
MRIKFRGKFMKISEKGKRRYDSVMNAGLELFLKNGFEKIA